MEGDMETPEVAGQRPALPFGQGLPASGRHCLQTLQHAAADLVAFDALEQRGEVAFAEAFVALALDDLEEDRADAVLGEDLQQLALVGFRIGVDQDLVLRQAGDVLTVVGHALVDHIEVGLRRIEEIHALRAHGFHRVVDVLGEAGDVLDALALVRVQVLVDLALRVGRFVQRNAHDAVRRGHRLGHQAGLQALDVEVADLAEVEQALVVVRPLLHVAEVQVVGQVVDEGQAEALRAQLGAGDQLVVAIEDAAGIAVAVHQVQHAVADALDDRGVDRLALRLEGDGFSAVAQRGLVDLRTRLLEADGEAAGARAVLFGEVGGERIGVFIDQEVDVALAIDGNRTLLVLEHRAEAHLAEVLVQLGTTAGRCGEFDELEAVDAHRVFEGGDLHAGVGMRGGRDCGIHGVAPNRCRIGTNQVRAGLDPARMQGTDPILIVTLETTSKVHRNMSPADPVSTRLRASHVLLDLEQFLPYRLSVLSNRVSGNIAKLYGDRYGLAIPEWRVITILALYPGSSASEVSDRTAMDKVAVSRAVARLLERGFIKRETHGDDRRRSVLALSAAGFEVYETIAPMVIEITRKLMSVLSEEEEQVLEKLILRLAGDGLERMGEGV
eukprot:TRINITY_DN27644_c0_g1_i1.p1 TRINITY_DN27644_c0_g1~~TRINITY_DN27644_c0_g1_i1.p1  ORF type:complete len:612 (-),score=250.58 TRINITY_DN27644_c0_g1_i1:79-1914(-)